MALDPTRTSGKSQVPFWALLELPEGTEAQKARKGFPCLKAKPKPSEGLLEGPRAF